MSHSLIPETNYTSENSVIGIWFVSSNVTHDIPGCENVPNNCCEDWLVLKRFDGFELAFDYENGLRFRATYEHVGDMVRFVKKLHYTLNLPFKTKAMVSTPVFSVVHNHGNSVTDPAKNKFLQEAGLVQDGEFDFKWNLLK